MTSSSPANPAKSFSVCGLVVAAGVGVRMSKDLERPPIPKQYQKLGSSPVLTHTLKALLQSNRFDRILVVIGAGQEAFYKAAVDLLSPSEQDKLLPSCLGGQTRQESVANGLASLAQTISSAGQDFNTASVLIHDAARPFVDAPLIERLLAALAHNPAVIPTLPVVDSLSYTQPSADALPVLTSPVVRDNLVAIQTPQAFHLPEILSAHQACARDGVTNLGDDSAVYRHSGGLCHSVPGSAQNFKLTEPQDFARAMALMNVHCQDIRTGQGFDIHRFCAGDHVVLGGVKIPHSHSLEGHSDADVLLHAVTDALFGAIGLPDIGVYFPPSDPQWRGAASKIFLQKALEELTARQGFIANIDATLICEAPKIAPCRLKIIETLADLCAIAHNRIAIKATTAEGLGFIGRREGIAAQAIVTIRLP